MKYIENPLHKNYDYDYDDDLSTCILDDFYENRRNNSNDTNATYVSNNDNPKKNKGYYCFSYYFCCFK